MKGYKVKYHKILRKIKEYVVSYYGDRLVSLVVFGSVANDTFSPVSDVDLLVVLEEKKSSYFNYLEFFDHVIDKIEIKGIQINPIFKTPQTLTFKLPFLWNTKFLILYDKGCFFGNFINDLIKFKREHLIFKDNYIEIVK